MDGSVSDATRRERPSSEPSAQQPATAPSEPPPPRADYGPETDEGDDEDDTLTTERFPDPLGGWDRYEYVSFIGRGGMGAVYKAKDPQLHRYVALKFLLRTEPERARKFVAEARAQARVEHEHVCKVYEVGNARGIPYIAMQFIDGVTLTAGAKQMTIDEKVQVMRKVAEAVHGAHQENLIHRDLKPSNVMVECDDNGRWQPFVLDFGLARAGAGVRHHLPPARRHDPRYARLLPCAAPRASGEAPRRPRRRARSGGPGRVERAQQTERLVVGG